MADDVLLQMITQNDQKHEDAHKRLRQSIREVEERLESNFEYLRDGHLAVKSRMDAAEQHALQPIDASKLVLSTKVVVGIVATAIALAAGMWASTAGVRSDVRDILTRMEAQKTATESTAKLQEVQLQSVKIAVDEMRRRQELQQYEISQLKEAILQRRER